MREALLFQFEKIGCRIASNVCGGLWQQCFIGNNVQSTWFRRFNDDFDLSDKKCENRPRKVEDCQLQALLDKDDIQSQKMLAEQLGVSQAAISMQLHAIEKVQKMENGCRMEMNGTTPKHTPNSACQTKKKVVPASDCDRR